MFIVLVSYYAVTNIGDKILTECLSKMLINMGHTVKIVDISGRTAFCENDDEELRVKKRLQSEQIRNDRNKFNEYLQNELSKCDLVIFGGGAILDVISNYVAEDIHSIVEIARERNIQVVFNSCGFYGSNFNNHQGHLIREALLSPNVKKISVRERAEDMRLLLKGEKPFSVCCDPAVWAREVYGINNVAIHRNDRKIGINLIFDKAYGLSQHNYGDLGHCYYEIYNELVKLGYECCFFINGCQKDLEFANSFMRRFQLSHSLFSQEYLPNGKSFVSYLSQFSLIISSRLHTSICSYSLKIPSLCLSWDDKMDEFYKSIGKKHWVLEREDIKNLTTKLDEALTIGIDDAQYNEYRNEILVFLSDIFNNYV